MMTSRRTDEQYVEEVHRIFREGTRRPNDVFRELLKWARDEAIPIVELPSQRTVRRIVDEYGQILESEPWSLGDAGPGDPDPRLVIPALEGVIAHTNAKVQSITKLEARWIARILAVAPDLGGWAAYSLAHRYIAREKAEQPTNDLDAFLALAPWRDDPREEPSGREQWRRWRFMRLLDEVALTPMDSIRDELVEVMRIELLRQAQELHGSIAPYVDERGEYLLVDGHVSLNALADAIIRRMNATSNATRVVESGKPNESNA